MKMKNVCVAVAAVSLAAMFGACSNDEPTKGSLKDGINAQWKAMPQDGGVCWLVKDSATATWPLHLVLPQSEAVPQAQPVLAGLRYMRYVDTSISGGGGPGTAVLNVALTPEGQATLSKWWDPKVGVCIGHRRVQEVKEFTIPGKNSEQATDVKFSWKIEDIPRWVDASKFLLQKGLTGPVDDEAIMMKTNNGWRIQ